MGVINSLIVNSVMIGLGVVTKVKVSSKADGILTNVFDTLTDEVYPKNMFGKRKLCKELRKKK